MPRWHCEAVPTPGTSEEAEEANATVNDQPTAAGPPQAVPRLAQREIHLKDLSSVVLRHWVLVVLLAGLVGGGAYFSGRNAIVQYQSKLTVQISSSKQVFSRLDDIDIDEMALRTDPILSEALILTTQGLAKEVVNALNLQLTLGDPTVFRDRLMTGLTLDTALLVPESFHLAVGAGGHELRDEQGTVIAQGTLEDPVVGPGFSFFVLPQPSPLDVGFSILSPAVAASFVTGGLSYRVRPSTNVVDILFTGTDQTLVPLILNNAAVQLRNLGVVRARGALGSRREYIQQQLAISEQALQQSLRDLQGFKEGQEITDLSAQQAAMVQTIRSFEEDRQLALVQIATIEDAMEASDSIGVETLNRLAAISNIANNTALSFQIRGLLELYESRRELTAGALGLRESNPEVSGIDERIRQGHAALRGAVDATIRSIQARVTALDVEIATEREQLRGFPGMETRMGQLNLESTILNEMHRYLLNQYQVARMQEATISPYIQILDSASPAFRIGSGVRQRVILGLLVGLMLGMAGAFFLEYLDQTVKSSSDIERILGIPVLGTIPQDAKLTPSSNGRRARVVRIDHLDFDEPAVESYRTLRTNVTFVGAEKPLQYIAVTSPGPREGKSTTAVNLAVTLAQAGRRTIIIDGDLRRPTTHRAFGLMQEPGLTDVLIGGVTAAEAIRTDVAQELDLLPAGSTPPNPSELLGSSAMGALIAELRHDYEYMIIDTPPTIPVTDAAVVATNADATILVLRSGDTEEHAAQRALDQLRRVNARIAGAVLNGVSHKKDPQYTYYSYRREPPTRSRLRAAGSKLAGMI